MEVTKSNGRHHFAPTASALTPPRGTVGLPVDLSKLADIRAAVARHGRSCGLSEQGVADLVLIANELTTNVVRHGGGVGQIRLWWHADGAACQVTDFGPGMPQNGHTGTVRVEPQSLTGRGIWMVRELCDGINIESGPTGTTVAVMVARP